MAKLKLKLIDYLAFFISCCIPLYCIILFLPGWIIVHDGDMYRSIGIFRSTVCYTLGNSSKMECETRLWKDSVDELREFMSKGTLMLLQIFQILWYICPVINVPIQFLYILRRNEKVRRNWFIVNLLGSFVGGIFFVATIAIFGKRVMEWQNTGVNLGWSYWINCSSIIVMIIAQLTTYIAMKRKVIQIDDFEYNPDADQICLISNDATEGQDLSTLEYSLANQDETYTSTSLDKKFENRGKLLLDAVIYNQTDIMLTLLRSGADPNMKVNDTTPLEEAATKGYGEATKYLLEAGAEVSREILVYVGYTVGITVIPSGLAPDGITYVSNSISNIYLSEPQNTAQSIGEARQVLKEWLMIPKEIRRLGSEAVTLFCQAKANRTHQSNLIRCMFVGHFGVGKTTLVKQLLNEKYDDIESTNGIDIYLGTTFYNKDTKQWHIQDRHTEHFVGLQGFVQVDIWDFAGQFIFYTTHQGYLSRRCLYFLVFDISMGLLGEVADKSLSSEGYKQMRVLDFLEFWIGSIRLYTEREETRFPKIVLIGTHLDKVKDYTTVDLIKEQIYHAFSDVIENGQLILRDDLFLNATDLSEEKLSFIRDIMVECGESYPEYGETLPASWMSLHEAMRMLKGKGQKIAMLEQIHELNKQLKRPMASDELKVCLLFFHEIGYILYFAENALCGTIILDPKVMIDAMKCIITCQDFVSIFWGSSEWKMMIQEGKVLRSYIEKVWKNVRKKEPFHKYRQHLLLTMEKLDLICPPKVYDNSAREEQESFYYIPCMVQKTVEMEDITQSENAVAFTYNFVEVLPPAVYHRLVASCLSLWQVFENHIYHDLIILRSGNFHLLQLKRDIKTIIITLQHLRGLPDIDINFCRVIKRFISETIDYILGTYITTKGMNLYKVEFNQSARSYMLFTNEIETKNGNEETCQPSCRGPLVEGMENEVSEMCLMRIACSLNMEQLHPLAANLLGSVAFLTEAEEDFPEFRQKDLAFFILHKWKNTLVERRSKPTMRILSDHFADADLSPHILCKAIRHVDHEAVQLNPMFLIKEAYPKLLDAISDRISTTYLHVGIELGFHFEEIKQFRMNNRRNTQKIIREMLMTWLDRNKSSGKATVAWLATALLNTQSNIEKLIEYEDTTSPVYVDQQDKKCHLM